MTPRERSSESIEAARAIFDAGLKAVDPYAAVARERQRLLEAIRERRADDVALVAVGKAAAPMARALLDGVGPHVGKGVVVTKYGHLGGHVFPERIATCESSHPVPDEASVRAADKVLEVAGPGRDGALVIVALSGGASALMVRPSPGVSLADKQHVTERLLKAGADIRELNAVRKHISAVKGGRLAQWVYPSSAEVLVLSDVLGDPLDVIASGPMAPDGSTCADALAVLRKYRLMEETPESVRARLLRGGSDPEIETPKAGDRVFERTHSVIVASNGQAVEAAQVAAERLGYRSTIVSRELQGEASVVGRVLARQALEVRKTLGRGDRACLVAGGETTVTVRGDGKGGRNTELAAAFASEVAGIEGVTCLSAGTDGTDGPTDAAGAIADGQTLAEASLRGLDLGQYLARNDTYTLFKAISGLVVTGPTGTNVMDLQVVLVER